MPAFPWFFFSMCCPLEWLHLCGDKNPVFEHLAHVAPPTHAQTPHACLRMLWKGWRSRVWVECGRVMGWCWVALPQWVGSLSTPRSRACTELMPARAVPRTRKRSAGVWPSVPGLVHQLGQLPYTSHIAGYALIYSYNASHTSTAQWAVMPC